MGLDIVAGEIDGLRLHIGFCGIYSLHANDQALSYELE